MKGKIINTFTVGVDDIPRFIKELRSYYADTEDIKVQFELIELAPTENLFMLTVWEADK